MMEIAKWNETFENADTRKRQRLGWLFIPTGCDSNGYLSLVAQEGGFEAFGIFLAICQWSATQPRELRGKLVRTNGAPLTEKDISVRIRAEACQVSAALKLLTSNDVGWITSDECHESADDLPVNCRSSPDFVQGQGQGEVKGQGEGDGGGRAREEFPELESEALAKQGKSLESIASRLAIPTETFTEHGKTLGLTEAKVRQWADSRVSNNWSTPKGRALGPMTWPADMNNFAAASNEISQKQNHGKNHTTANRNDGTANAGRAGAFAGIGKRRTDV